ncbi:hypothetical protein Q0601_14850 [Paracoccus onubensis]|uniref:hypothetical protein n=1 Tax=Paracoccus onubensis TaxID=1675788 RepID=UPI002730EF72|nr:hypothetical protein [Paracoccus onubensis]MDP0928462.1 hypothetical protein [Paracoccus onubensis]
MIVDILAILGVISVFAPLPVPQQMLQLDLWVMLGAALLPGAFLLRGISITRIVGLAGYAVYVWVLL